ncbi:uncharacterized protein E0L32_011611 [Thyridium curvatum]|uniref:Enoyl reductase (ER) domain-containing protein n=1 Tax=Thyridium curvatum TaxID=1093900 RepID=A0A507BNX6_9PEZI|nr:uncharacterized protein E0L32_011611 [Thyridium curvatum]TPX18498.1 hypothetical protein E0L32_011611 [Thyridium curvatum]
MSNSLPKTYKAAVLEKTGGKLVLKDVPLKNPGPGEVLVKVLASGVCGTDAGVQQGHFGDIFPLVLGHEYVGDVVAVGEGVTKVKVNDRVGGGWHGGHDGACRSCQRGFYQTCDNKAINGVSKDGGYAEYALLRAEAAVRLPSDIDPAQAAPLLCAGVTVFNGMRKLHVEQGNLVAVQGLGGLGHLAVQYARAMGYQVAALSSSGAPDKRDFARKLGAHEFVDTSAEDAAEALAGMGGAALIVVTAPNPEVISPLVGGLQPGGKLLCLAPVGPVPFDTVALVTKGASVHGWPSGHALDSEEAVRFAQTHGVECMVEKFPLSDVQKAFDHMTSGKARFRAVLTM